LQRYKHGLEGNNKRRSRPPWMWSATAAQLDSRSVDGGAPKVPENDDRWPPPTSYLPVMYGARLMRWNWNTVYCV
jgi:hypothetical protein